MIDEIYLEEKEENKKVYLPYEEKAQQFVGKQQARNCVCFNWDSDTNYTCSIITKLGEQAKYKKCVLLNDCFCNEYKPSKR